MPLVHRYDSHQKNDHQRDLRIGSMGCNLERIDLDFLLSEECFIRHFHFSKKIRGPIGYAR